MDEFLPDLGLADEGEIGGGSVLEVQFHCLPEIRDRFRTAGAKGRDVNVQTLGDEELLFPIDAVGDRLHAPTLARGARRNNG